MVPLEFGALIERVVSMDFDAVYFGFRASDTDPAANLDFWLSSAAFHLWNPSQPTPATDWERRIDELFGQQLAVSDMDERLRLFYQVQTIFAEHQPILYFAAPVDCHLGANGQCRALVARALPTLERRLTGRSAGTDPLALTW